MNYSDSFRSGPTRRYSERAEADEIYHIRQSRHYPADTSARERYDDMRERPGPSSAPPRRPNVPRETVHEYEEIHVNVDPGPSIPRPSASVRRERVDEPEILHADPGPSSRPSARTARVDDEPEIRHVDSGPDLNSYEHAGGRHHRPPPLYGIPIIDEQREYGRRDDDFPLRPRYFRPRPRPWPVNEQHDYGRRDENFPQRPPHLRPRPLPRPVPSGTVRVSPFLNRPDLVTGHDLALRAEQRNPKDDARVRNSIVLCVYRHSKKAFDYRFVQLMNPGHRLDRAPRPEITDLQLFKKMRMKYDTELRGWIRRLFSFKALSTVRLLQYGDGLLFRPEQEDDIFSSKFMKIWWNPNEQLKGAQDRFEWRDWILDQKGLQANFDMAIELIEDYVPDRIVFFIGLGLIAIVALTSVWLVKGGDPGLVSTVMSFVLAFIAAVVALTAIWDWFDGERSKELQERAVIVLPNYQPQFLPFSGPGKEKVPMSTPDIGVGKN